MRGTGGTRLSSMFLIPASRGPDPPAQLRIPPTRHPGRRRRSSSPCSPTSSCPRCCSPSSPCRRRRRRPARLPPARRRSRRRRGGQRAPHRRHRRCLRRLPLRHSHPALAVLPSLAAGARPVCRDPAQPAPGGDGAPLVERAPGSMGVRGRARADPHLHPALRRRRPARPLPPRVQASSSCTPRFLRSPRAAFFAANLGAAFYGLLAWVEQSGLVPKESVLPGELGSGQQATFVVFAFLALKLHRPVRPALTGRSYASSRAG